MIVGGYSLHLYCDTAGCVNQSCAPSGSDTPSPPGEFHGETGAGCIKQARRKGWVINHAGKAFCPLCSKERK